VQLAVDDQPGAGAQPGQDEHQVGGVSRGPAPGLGERGQLAVVLHEHRTRHPCRQVAGQIHAGPLGQRLGEQDLPAAVDQPGGRHPGRPGLELRHSQHPGDRSIGGGQPVATPHPRRDRHPTAVQDHPVQIGDHGQYLLPADVHAEQVTGGGVEAVPARRTAHPARGGLDLGHPAQRQQLAHHVLGRGAGQSDPLRELGQGQGGLILQSADRAVRVELAEAGEIPAGDVRGQLVPLAYDGPDAFNGVPVNSLEGTSCLR
jgi:hypothetical protein